MKSFFTKWGLTLSLVIITIHFIAQFLGEEYKVVEALSKAFFFALADDVFICSAECI